MIKFLCVQHTYNGIEAALFYESKLIDKVFEDKKRASKYFVTCIQSLLENNECKLDDLSFFATNKGPGPFTTLRVVLASVNGLAFSLEKPIIGIDGLDAILQEYKLDENLVSIALLEACSKDVYFGISYKYLNSELIQENKGCKNIDVFLQEIKSLFFDRKIHFIGNATAKYRDKIVDLFGDLAILDKIVPEVCSVDAVGKMAFEMWGKKEGLEKQVLPVYLKSMVLNKTA